MKKHDWSIRVSLILIVLFSLSACGESVALTAPTPPSELDRMVDAQTAATKAAADLRAVQAKETSRAQATREYLVLQGQQTRIAQEAVQTQTIAAQNARETQTRYAQNYQATATTQAIQQTATAQAAQFTATASAQQSNATATMQAQIVELTRVAASATATANASNAIATRASAATTATRVTDEAITFAEKQGWERRTEMWRSIGMLISVVVLTIGAIAVGLFLAYAGGTAIVRRSDRLSDARGTPYIWNGKTLVAPTRNPGAITRMLADGTVKVEAVDADVTKRDQAIQLALAGTSLDEYERVETEQPQPESANWQIEQAFQSKPLPLHQQPSRLALPVGVTKEGGNMWVPLPSVTHALVAGSSRMGKTRVLHGWVLALLHGGQCDLTLIDGKQGIEFARYAGKPRVSYVEDDHVIEALGRLHDEMALRNRMLREVGATDLREYNRTPGIPTALSHIVVVVDEIASLQETDGAMDGLIELARKAGNCGIHLVTATQHPDTKTIDQQILANAIVRIAFSVPHAVNSVAILGCGGAQKLGGIVGRMLLMYSGTLVECQSYVVDVPRPAMKELPPRDSEERPLIASKSSTLPDEIAKMVKWAIEQGGGWFRIEEVARAVGKQTDQVNAAALWLERQGLLTQVLRDAHGHNTGRRLISDALQGVL